MRSGGSALSSGPEKGWNLDLLAGAQWRHPGGVTVRGVSSRNRLFRSEPGREQPLQKRGAGGFRACVLGERSGVAGRMCPRCCGRHPHSAGTASLSNISSRNSDEGDQAPGLALTVWIALCVVLLSLSPATLQ